MNDTIYAIADAQGWDDQTLGMLALNFIDYAGMKEGFISFLRETALEENSFNDE